MSVQCNVPQQVPRIVALLSESYNSHVRYGACLAIGTACAGSGFKEALALLEPLSKDRVDYVRQGAFLAQAMVCMQINENKEPRVKAVRKALFDSLTLKGDTMTKFGGILAMGIIDAGGRNQTISLLSPAGYKKMAAIVGMALFPQFWYWYPFVHFISLAFTPTTIIGLNKQMRVRRRRRCDPAPRPDS
jgi:26S proteasome regulatory subunit N2